MKWTLNIVLALMGISAQPANSTFDVAPPYRAHIAPAKRAHSVASASLRVKA